MINIRKKILKIGIIILYTLLILSIFSNVYAEGISSNFTGEMETTTAVNPIIDILKAVLFVIRTAGIVIATVILMVIACKYMVASAGDRADIKKYAMSYIIGAVIMFGTAGIAGILQTIINEAFGGGAGAGT